MGLQMRQLRPYVLVGQRLPAAPVYLWTRARVPRCVLDGTTPKETDLLDLGFRDGEDAPGSGRGGDNILDCVEGARGKIVLEVSRAHLRASSAHRWYSCRAEDPGPRDFGARGTPIVGCGGTNRYGTWSKSQYRMSESLTHRGGWVCGGDESCRGGSGHLR